MAGVNKVIIIGNLGQDPEQRFMPDGKAVANISVATSETWKDKNTGERKERTEWHRIVFFGKLAEIVSQYLKKGSKIYVEGSLKTRQWEKEGQKHYTTEIMGRSMQMLDSKGDSSSSSSGSNQSQDFGPPPIEDFDDDIPF